MSEFQRELVPPGAGYPPLSTLPVPPLTSVHTPEAARAALLAESQTSVLDPVGLRRLWWQEGHLVVVTVLFVLAVVATLQFFATGHTPGWWLFWLPAVIVSNLAGTNLPVAVTRAQPAPGVLPRMGPARWRWYRDLRRHPVALPPVAAWPPGSEAYALLAAAASVQSVAPSWLGARVGLPADIATQWASVLRRQGWLTGGGRVLGLRRLPELHVQVTVSGRACLEQERARLTALAAG